MIIVTGGAGFIGSNIVKALNDRGITDILVVDNLKHGTKVINLVNLRISDYIDKKNFLVQIIANKKFNDTKAIFHEGACSSTTEWNGSYMMHNNYQYSKILLHYCLEHKIPLLYASSSAIYGNRVSNFIESREYEQPLNIYGYSKFLFDEYVRHILPKADSQIVGLRYFNVYGPHEEHKGKMASIAFRLNTQINNSEIPKLFEGSSNFKRDFVHIDDVVDINLWFLEHGISGIFNLGTGCAESFQKVADSILAFHKKDNIEYIPLPKKLKRYYQTFTQADLTNLRAAGYNKPFKTIAEGIRKYMNWLNRDTLE